MLAGTRTDNLSPTPHRSPPERFRNTDRPSTIALTTNLLNAFATINNTQTTASTDNLLDVFRLTNNIEERVERL
ncbi:MAG: hypothetical protein KME16_26895 [Scytolyngbya sp. HA4215-MV1]|nr:hypothetical protein [Scytolyngbya sp. HA4215-MV1]